MGRMLEALRQIEEPSLAPEPIDQVAAPSLVTEEPPEEDMPFVEVGGPRPKPAPAELAPRLDMPAPRTASLHVRAPAGVALHTPPQTPTARPRVASELIAFHQPDHAVSQQYATLFGQLEIASTDDIAPALVFTSLTPGA